MAELDEHFDYDISVPGECIVDFKMLLRAGLDALGDDEADKRAERIGRDLLDDIAKFSMFKV